MKLAGKLFKAAADGDAALIACSKARGASVFCQDDDDNTPLHIAAQRGHRAAVYQLLRRKGSVLASAHNLAEETPFTLAVRHGHTDIAGLLLETKSVDINEQNDLGETPLHIAVASDGATDMIRLLLAANADINIKNKQGYSPLDLARKSGNGEIEQQLLKENPKLRLLARSGNIDGMRRLIAEGADIHTRDFAGESALGKAFDFEEHAVVDFLISEGARLSLMETIRYGNSDDVKHLLIDGADVNEKTYDSNTPLLCAIDREKPEIVHLLLAAGANVNYSNLWCSPLTQAALSNDHTEILQILLAAGAEVNAFDDYGDTALLNAAIRGKAGAVSLLVRAGADVNLANEDGTTPLHSAILSRNANTVRALLAAGASPHARMHNIITPLDMADSPEIVAILQNLS